MNDNPRLGFFDVDPDKFAAMLNELIEQDIVCEVEDDYDDSMDGDWDSAMWRRLSRFKCVGLRVR